MTENELGVFISPLILDSIEYLPETVQGAMVLGIARKAMGRKYVPQFRTKAQQALFAALCDEPKKRHKKAKENARARERKAAAVMGTKSMTPLLRNTQAPNLLLTSTSSSARLIQTLQMYAFLSLRRLTARLLRQLPRLLTTRTRLQKATFEQYWKIWTSGQTLTVEGMQMSSLSDSWQTKSRSITLT